MALTDLVILPGADYQGACDALRSKTGTTAPIRSGELKALIEGIGGAELPELEKLTWRWPWQSMHLKKKK